jgi:hypothetical protein
MQALKGVVSRLRRAKSKAQALQNAKTENKINSFMADYFAYLCPDKNFNNMIRNADKKLIRHGFGFEILIFIIYLHYDECTNRNEIDGGRNPAAI